MFLFINFHKTYIHISESGGIDCVCTLFNHCLFSSDQENGLLYALNGDLAAHRSHFMTSVLSQCGPLDVLHWLLCHCDKNVFVYSHIICTCITRYCLQTIVIMAKSHIFHSITFRFTVLLTHGAHAQRGLQ